MSNQKNVKVNCFSIILKQNIEEIINFTAIFEDNKKGDNPMKDEQYKYKGDTRNVVTIKGADDSKMNELETPKINELVKDDKKMLAKSEAVSSNM